MCAAALDALLGQLTELRDGVDERQQTLAQQKQRQDDALRETLEDWAEKARCAARDAAGRLTRFFR